jgi:hypothetical protein
MSGRSSSEQPIRELELTRAPSDRHLYFLEGIGTIHREGGMWSNSFIAEAAGHSWRFAGRGILRRQLEATTPDGSVVGRFVPRDIRRGGLMEWGGRQLALRPASIAREKYVLRDGDRDIILVEGRAWGRRPVTVTFTQADAIEPGLVLFVAFVVHRLAVNASSSGGSAAVIASTSSCS